MKLLARIVVWIAAVMVALAVVLGGTLVGLRWRNQVGRRIDSPPGIDRLAEYRIGGINQWVHIRGRGLGNPVVLYLHGGPGAPMMPYEHLFQDAWEQGFTVVQWDQRGAGKTALSNDQRSPTPGDSAAVRELEGIAPYPEATRNVPKEMTLRKWQVAYGFARAKYRTLKAAERGQLLNALTSPVYRLSDLRVFWSPEWTNHAYDNVGSYLMHHDARAWGLTFPIPLFFFVGRDDWQTPGVVAKAYLDAVTAPYKEFQYVAGAAHATPVEQPEAFAELMLQHVRPIALAYGCGRPVTP